MLTNDKTITAPDYWAKIYEGKNDNAKVDASNLTRPKNAFDRFGWVAKHAEGAKVLGIASGHAHIEKRIKAAHPDWHILASDQTGAAMKAANYKPYQIINAYDIPHADKSFQTVICCQAWEYFEYPDTAMMEMNRVAHVLLMTVPVGEMKLWSQLRIYTEDSVKNFVEQYGTIEVFERHDDLLLVKLRFND